ncbi:MAG: hydrolase [Patescibacteria group bacterium]|jgi:hypothetical protein
MNKTNNECCPKFDPTLWDGKTLEWDNKKFIKTSVRTFLFIPLNFGAVMTKVVDKVEKSDAKMLDGLVLSEHTSKWNMDLYVAVDQPVPSAENTTLSGKFLCKVYEGDFKDTKAWCDDFEKIAKDNKLNVEKWYMWYTTCPKCAKKYGHNYVVIVAKVK